MRYVVKRTDRHWDKCWGVFDTIEKKWVMKDTVKKHCVAKADELLAPKWVTFTKRTNHPKLGWLENQLDEAGIMHRCIRESFHAPILEVLESDLDAAWDILTPVDDIPDDDPMFGVCDECEEVEGSIAYFDRYIAGDR